MSKGFWTRTTVCVRARWTRSVFWWWRDIRDTAKRTRSTGGQRGTAAPMYVRARRGLPDACCKLCSSTWDACARPAIPATVHGSCRRAAGCGAGTRRGGVRGLCTHHRRGRPRSAAEGADGDGSGTGRPDQTSNRAGGQRRLGVSGSTCTWDSRGGYGSWWSSGQLRFEMSVIWRARCRYRIADDLALWLRKASGGRICALERSLRRIESIVQGRPDGSLIRLADMAGRELARDRSHRPIRVPNPQPELWVVR